MALVRCEAAKVMASQREAGDSIKHRGRELNAKADPSSKQGLQANLGTLTYLLTHLLSECLTVSSIALGYFGWRHKSAFRQIRSTAQSRQPPSLTRSRNGYL